MQHVANQRRDFHHKTARHLVRQHGLIAHEDLNVRGIARSRLAKSTQDAGWAAFLTILAHKAAEAGVMMLRIRRQMTEGIRLHMGLGKQGALDRAVEMLRLVGIPAAERRVHHYPHQLSGGMRQRVVIAIALSCNPSLVLADEPTTALDVTIQAQILELLRSLMRERGSAVLLITHDLGVVAGMCDRVLVTYAGSIVEEAPRREIFYNPRHPYTIGLLHSAPRLDGTRAGRLPQIEGPPPDLARLPRGCPFQACCPFVTEICRHEMPPLPLLAALSPTRRRPRFPRPPHGHRRRASPASPWGCDACG